MMPAGESVPAFSWLLVYIGVGLGAASALIQVVMNWAQRSVSPTRATVIYAGEPVVAGILGRIAGERLPPGVFLGAALRSEEHTSELQSLMRNSYAVFCWKKKKIKYKNTKYI